MASDAAAEAIFKWVFEKPSHVDAEDNENKFYAHRCVGHLAAMKIYDGKIKQLSHLVSM